MMSSAVDAVPSCCDSGGDGDDDGLRKSSLSKYVVHGICSRLLPRGTLASPRQSTAGRIQAHQIVWTYPSGRANSLWLGDGMTVPVEDADDADDESSSTISGKSVR